MKFGRHGTTTSKAGLPTINYLGGMPSYSPPFAAKPSPFKEADKLTRYVRQGMLSASNDRTKSDDCWFGPLRTQPARIQRRRC